MSYVRKRLKYVSHWVSNTFYFKPFKEGLLKESQWFKVYLLKVLARLTCWMTNRLKTCFSCHGEGELRLD